MYQRKRSDWKKHIDFMVVDLICLVIAFCIAYAIRFGNGSNPFSQDIYRDLIVVYCIAEILTSIMVNNLNRVITRGLYDELINVLMLSFLSAVFIIVYMYVVHVGSAYSRLLIAYTTLVFVAVDYIGRLFWKQVIIRINKIPVSESRKTPLFVLTDSNNANSIITILKQDEANHYSVKAIGLVDFYSKKKKQLNSIDEEIAVVSLDEASDYICREWIDEVIVYLPNDATNPVSFIDDCRQMGITIHQVLNIKGVVQNKQFIEDIGEYTVLTTAFNYMMPYQVLVKRLFDIFTGIIGCLVTLMLALIIGPIIAIKSPGPIFFKQERIGQNGKHFKMLKFRSMVMNADEMKMELQNSNTVSDGMMFKMDNDPRIIPGIGNFIRKWSLDEFPQFINVLKGDMSLIGTRPPTVDEWEKYKYHHRARLAMKPGITGMWQVSGRSQITDFEKVVELDTWYITNWRISLDIKILLKTFVVLFQRKGAK